MTDAEIKELVRRLKYYYVARADCREAAELIESVFLGPRFRHLKRGSSYTVVGKVRLQFSTTVPQDDDMLVLYRDSEKGTYSARAPEEFHDGRFERIEE